MARLSAPPAKGPVGSPCFLHKLAAKDPELCADVLAALDTPEVWPAQALATELSIGVEAIRKHRRGGCQFCTVNGPPNPTA